MSTFTITTQSGNVLDNLTLNGSMFVSESEVSLEDDLNEDELSSVVIVEHPEEGEDIVTERENLVCDAVLHWPEGYLFNLRDMTDDEKMRAELDARISFLEMMGGWDE